MNVTHNIYDIKLYDHSVVARQNNTDTWPPVFPQLYATRISPPAFVHCVIKSDQYIFIDFTPLKMNKGKYHLQK